ncbi:MAG: penicillin-insensitive murein endopeptidase [Pseudomonadota bacterium]
MGRRTGALALLTAALLAVGGAEAQTAKQLFEAERTPSGGEPVAIGRHSRGCLAGGLPLATTGPTWQAMRLSRNRYWGHPDLLRFVQRLSRVAAEQPGWNGLYVGDLGLPKGGPVSGHASHQIGLDVDIWMRPGTDLTLSRQARENISSISTRRANGAFVNDNWSRAHHEILKAAASDPRVARIFVFPGAKVQMCNDERGNRAWLRKIRPWWGHHFHFHVRLTCPPGAASCVDQAPPPPGDGCADAEDWVANILNPPPPDPNATPAPPRAELVLADLPRACTQLLSQ